MSREEIVAEIAKAIDARDAAEKAALDQAEAQMVLDLEPFFPCPPLTASEE